MREILSSTCVANSVCEARQLHAVLTSMLVMLAWVHGYSYRGRVVMRRVHWRSTANVAIPNSGVGWRLARGPRHALVSYGVPVSGAPIGQRSMHPRKWRPGVDTLFIRPRDDAPGANRVPHTGEGRWVLRRVRVQQDEISIHAGCNPPFVGGKAESLGRGGGKGRENLAPVERR